MMEPLEDRRVLDGQGLFPGEQFGVADSPSGDYLSSVAVADLNGDGLPDLVTANSWSNDISVLLQRRGGEGPVEGIPGDANKDGRFDSLDLVAVLQAGKYGTGQPATWEEGDWNGDGVFDQLDIVAALQSGAFLQENRLLSVDSAFADI